MTYESIREPILKDIAAFATVYYEIMVFTLTCSEETLTERYNKRGDDWGLDFHWLHLPPYPGDYIINTDDIVKQSQKKPKRLPKYWNNYANNVSRKS